MSMWARNLGKWYPISRRNPTRNCEILVLSFNFHFPVRRYTGKEDYEFGDITKATLRRVGGAVEWLSSKTESSDSTGNSGSTPDSPSLRGVREGRREPYLPQSRDTQSSSYRPSKRRRTRSLIDEHMTAGSTAPPSVEPTAPVAEAAASAPTLAELSFSPDESSTQPEDYTSRTVSKATGTIDMELVCKPHCIASIKQIN